MKKKYISSVAAIKQTKPVIIQKNNKHGFTLAELVVVIAILAILAAIAIPSMISIIYSAGDNVQKNNADEINKACKNYYAMVMSGQITSLDHGSSTQTNLPASNSSSALRKMAAKNATVVNACEYAELPGIISEIENGDNAYVYDPDDGKIYAIQSRGDLTTYVTSSLKLGDLYS